MVTWSQFVDYASENRRSVPASQWEAIRREAVGRLQARYAAGYASTPLDFSDLAERMEGIIAGAR